MSVRGNGFGVSLARPRMIDRTHAFAVSLLLQGCAVSAIGADDDANLNLTRADAASDAALEAGVAELPDAGSPSPDASPADYDAGQAAKDGGSDKTPAPPDAGMEPGRVDAGSQPPDAEVETLPLTIDGVVHDSEWQSATWTMQSIPSNWGATKNVLLSLGVLVKDGALWLAVRGSIESTNAIVVYLDSTPDMGLAPGVLTDQTGALDDALSAALTTPVSFGAEVAWGTRGMAVSATSGFDASTGFRSLVGASAANLSWIDGSEAPTVCSASACEARLPLTYLGAGTKVSLFARITSATGGAFANQTLPLDAADAPATVTELLTIAR